MAKSGIVSGGFRQTDSGGEFNNVKAYGAVGDGVTDDTVAIQATIAAAAAGSGVAFFPYGQYNYTHLDARVGGNGTLTLRGSQGYQWTGNLAGTATQSKSRLHCTATDALDGIVAFQTQGFIVEDLGFSYADGYTGILLNLGGNGGVGTNSAIVQRCHFISDTFDTYRTAKAFIGLNNIVCVFIYDCSFMGAQSLIRGRESNTAFSNVVVINQCQFEDCAIGAIVNPYLNWEIDKCLFEFTNADIPCSLTTDGEGGEILPGYETDIKVTRCWFWDPASPSTQIPIKQPLGSDWNIKMRDNWFHTFNRMANMHGTGAFSFTGNRIQQGVPINAETLVDCGNSATALKSRIFIAENDWPSNGSQALAFINTTGHGAYKNEGNAHAHANWDTSL